MALLLKRSGRAAVWALALVVSLPLLLLSSILLSRFVEFVRDSRPYAAKVFDGVVPYDAVLASRRWNPLSGGLNWGCTYAVVDLPDDAPEEPPTRGRDETEWWLVFGGEWQPTPAAPLGEDTRDALSFCSRHWEEELGERLAAATESADSWYVRDEVGETVFVYSLPQRVAARVRFGD